MISDKMLAALKMCQTPFKERDPWDVVECLSLKEGIPYKVALRRMEKASAHQYLDYGTSIRSAWLTPEGHAAIAEREEANQCAPSSSSPS